MKTFNLILLLIFASQQLVGQVSSTKKTSFNDAIFPGGSVGLTKFLDDNLVIPADFKGKGAVSVKFTIDETGLVQDVLARHVLEDCPPCTQAAIDVVRKMPTWQPAFSNVEQKNVESIKIIQVSFQREK